jgi:large subunit ribosomal protein L9
MKVILLRDVARIGRRNEVIEVPSGHAQNFLIPRKLAVPATPDNLKKVIETKHQHAVHTESRQTQFSATLDVLKSTPISLTVPANAQGHLFRGIHVDDIVAAAAKQGISVEASTVILDHPIKTIGEHAVTLSLEKQSGALQLQVIAQ